MIESLLFWSCCLCTVAGALGAAVVRNLFHASLLLGLSLVGVAGLYLFLEASYVACVQVIVYVGGILVLILFATLFSSDVRGEVQRTPRWLQALGIAGALVAGAVAVRLMQVTIWNGKLLEHARSATGAVDAIGGADRSIGDLLVGSWFVPFVAAGFLLTVALVGASATVRRFRRRAEVRGA